MSAAGSSFKTPAHEHMLDYGNTMEWRCNVCKRTSEELQQSHSYRCTECKFNLCTECTNLCITPVKTDKHVHPLKFSDATIWGCHSCGTTSVEERSISWYCKECLLHLCYGCIKDHKSTEHPHMLRKADPKNLYPAMSNWTCNRCTATFDRRNPQRPYHCARDCKFDLCESCMKDTAISTVTDVNVDAVETKMEKSLSLTDETAPNGTEASVEETEPAAKVFISYKWPIMDEVLMLKTKLEAKGITCWMDISNMAGGDDMNNEMDKGIRGCEVMVSCVTKAYSESQACQQEVALANRLSKTILPLLFESIDWPPEGAMAIPFALLLYVDCIEHGLNTENLKKVLKTIQSKVQ